MTHFKKRLTLCISILALQVVPAQAEITTTVNMSAVNTAITAGDVKAMYFLASCFYHARCGYQKNTLAAFNWYEQAAKLGHAASKVALADMYLTGTATTANPQKAIELLTEAADQGETHAQTALGLLYSQAKVVTQDYTKALHYLNKATESNDATAELFLGHLYQHGIAVNKDHTQAKLWYQRAKTHGHPHAQLMLSRLD